MIPIAGKTYYIDYSEGDDYSHYHGLAECETGRVIDIDGICYAFTLKGYEDGEMTGITFPVQSIIKEI